MNIHPTVLDIEARSRRYTDLYRQLAEPEAIRTFGRMAWTTSHIRAFVCGIIAARSLRRPRAGSSPAGPVQV